MVCILDEIVTKLILFPIYQQFSSNVDGVRQNFALYRRNVGRRPNFMQFRHRRTARWRFEGESGSLQETRQLPAQLPVLLLQRINPVEQRQRHGDPRPIQIQLGPQPARPLQMAQRRVIELPARLRRLQRHDHARADDPTSSSSEISTL